DVFEDMGMQQKEDQIIVRKMGKYFLFKPITAETTKVPYYMLVLKSSDPMGLYFINKDFETFVKIFNKIVKS
ncbi:MAG: hypothetical protein ACFE96_10875, partial [Candidatus Hermodarchaeota archaeon]